MRLSSDDKVHTVRADLNGLMRVLCNESTDIDPERQPIGMVLSDVCMYV